jgi:hypothetical protein
MTEIFVIVTIAAQFALIKGSTTIESSMPSSGLGGGSTCHMLLGLLPSSRRNKTKPVARPAGERRCKEAAFLPELLPEKIDLCMDEK